MEVLKVSAIPTDITALGAENILEIKGVGENILAGILAEMGDISSVQTPIPFRLLNFRIASPSDICQTASRLNAPL